MKKPLAFLLSIAFIPLLHSCANGDISELLRSYDDPSDDTPAARCYEQAHTVSLTWRPDPCADTFILMRAEDDGAEVFEEVYSGGATKYTDTFPPTDDQRRVLYRLDKVRGTKLFKGSDCACAVVSATLHDLHEPDGTAEQAVELERIITATMPCSQFRYKGRAFGDEDWFYIRLKPLCRAYIEFVQLDIDSSVPDTCFLLTEQGGLPQDVANRSKIVVENSTLASRCIYFKICPDLNKLFSGVPGASVPAYRMELSEEVYK